jgi:small subunit ribosomal protein S9
MVKVVHVSGKRKRAIARATVRVGKGRITINRKMLDNVDPSLARIRMREPIILAGDVVNKMNISVRVIGGGIASQADAVRLAIARAILEFTSSKDIEKRFLAYDRQLLVADIRRKEKRKPNTHGHARSKRQKSYR